MSDLFLTINGELLKACSVFFIGASLLIMITASIVVSQQIAQTLWLRWMKGTIAPIRSSYQSQNSRAIELAILVRFSEYVKQQIHRFLENEDSRTEAALIASETKLAAVLDVVTAVITRFRVFPNFDLQYDYISPRSRDVFGYLPEEIMADNQLWMSRVVPEDWESVISPAFEDLLAGRTVTVEYRFRHRDGSVCWISDTSTSQWDEAAQCWIVTCVETDITQRKQAEIALKQSEAELQALFRAMTDVVLTFDRQGRYLNIATTQTPLLCQPASELIGKTVYEVLSPKLADTFISTIQHALATRQVINVEYELEISGQKTCCSANVSPLSESSVVWVARDISDRKSAEEALRQSEARFKALVQNSFDIIQVMDERFTITDENPAVERILGYPPKLAPLDQTLPNIHPDDLPQVQAVMAVLLTQPGVPIKLNYRTQKADGVWVWLESIVTNWLDDPDIGAIVANSRDITEHKLIEETLRQSEARNRAIISAIPDLLIQMNREGDYLSVVRGSKTKLLHEEQLAAGINIYDIMPFDSAQERMGYVHQALQTGEIQFYEYQLVIDGETCDEEARIARVDNDEVLAIVRDITDRKQAERALRQSEETNRAILSAIPDLLIRMTQNGTYLSVVKGSNIKLLSAEMLVVGTNIYDMLPADFAQERMNYVHQALQTGKLQFCEYQIAVDGEVRDEEARIVSVGSDEALIMVRDITDRKQAERALRHSEATNRAIISAIPDHLLQINREGVYLNFIKAGNVKLLNADRITIGSSLYDILPFDIAQERMGYVQRVLETGELQVYEYQIVVDGEIRDEEARITAISNDEALLMVRDITDRKQAERALRQSEATNRAMISAIPDLLIRMNREGICLDVVENQNVKLFKPKFDTMGRNIFDLMPFELAQQRLDCIQRALQSGELQLYEQQVEIEGTLYDEEVRIVRIMYDEEVRIVRINDDEALVMIRNISQQQTALRERKRAEKALRQQIEREQAINRVIQTIRNSLDLTTVFSTAAREVINLLPVDRVSIVKYLPDQNCWRPVAEYLLDPKLPTRLYEDIPDQGNPLASRLKQHHIVQVDDTNSLTDEISRSRAQDFPGAWLLVRLDIDGSIWGGLTLMKIPQPSPWQDSEVELASAIADQLAIAIQQSQLYQQVQQLNVDLEQQVQDRTTELQQALSFEALLKRITDKVRDSLDENQILQTAVGELGIGLHVECCNAALHNLELATATISHEYTISQPFALGQEVSFFDCPNPEVIDQLCQGQYSQFCFTVDTFIQPSDQLFAILACPIFDDQGLLGDLWLYKQKQDCFSELEIRLVQQVANQCAIALRQSRLYQAEQAQVQELERLNHLKDDFLSTVSHELRTPMSNIKMATQMLEVSLKQLGILEIKNTGAPPSVENHAGSSSTKHSVDKAAAKEKEKENRVMRYLQILREECYRETRLINDLLDLSRLDFEAEPLTLNDLSLQYWIPQITEVFIDRIHDYQQQLSVEIPTDLPSLTTDFNYLELILTELLHNACKYTPAGEEIVVIAKTAEGTRGGKGDRGDRGEVSSISSPSSSSLFVSVCNSGVEIPPQELSRVFDKFYRVPNNDPWKHGGTGLGLTLIKRRVERIQGTIAVTSGQGWTRFTVQLPWKIEV